MELADDHRAVFDVLLAEPAQLLSLILGSGVGHSVLETVLAFEAANTVADSRLGTERLGWRTQCSLADTSRVGSCWPVAIPNGFAID